MRVIPVMNDQARQFLAVQLYRLLSKAQDFAEIKPPACLEHDLSSHPNIRRE
jgi:hypothetical protein